jgi:exopolysaccharide production protein ExoQ
MPKELAAFIITAFIAWLFRRHAKEETGVSNTIWIPFIWFAIGASRPIVYWLASGNNASSASGTGDGSPIDRLIFLILLFAGIGTLLKRQIDWSNVSRNCGWLLAFYGYLLLSTIWSDYSFISFKRWIKDVGDVVMILVILTDSKPEEAIRWVLIRTVYLLVPVSVLFIKYYPELGRYYSKWTWETAYCGVSMSKNGLGALAMLSGLVMLWQMVDIHRTRRPSKSWTYIWPDLVVFFMCIWVLNLAGSSTAIACFILGILVFFCSRLDIVDRLSRHSGLIVGSSATLMIFTTLNEGFRGTIAGALGKNSNLTERTVIWDWALNLDTNPLIGTGFASLLLTYANEPLVAIDHLSHVHNGYLHTYTNTGLIGVFFILAILLTAGRNVALQLARKSNSRYFLLSLLLIALFYNYTEVAFNRTHPVGFLLWIVAALGAAKIEIEEREGSL